MPRWPERTALQRFVEKCRFDPASGCVLWVGGTTQGRGHHVPYGSFWFEGRRWFAHRWAAKFIHGHEIAGLQVDHECTNTLCQQHLRPVEASINRELQWIRVQVGCDPYPYPEPEPCDGIPFHWPPPWLENTHHDVKATSFSARTA
jgi:hypothetical protein